MFLLAMSGKLPSISPPPAFHPSAHVFPLHPLPYDKVYTYTIRLFAPHRHATLHELPFLALLRPAPSSWLSRTPFLSRPELDSLSPRRGESHCIHHRDKTLGRLLGPFPLIRAWRGLPITASTRANRSPTPDPGLAQDLGVTRTESAT